MEPCSKWLTFFISRVSDHEQFTRDLVLLKRETKFNLTRPEPEKCYSTRAMTADE